MDVGKGETLLGEKAGESRDVKKSHPSPSECGRATQMFLDTKEKNDEPS